MNRSCHPRLFLTKQDQQFPIHTCKDDISFVIFRIGSEKIHWTLGQFHLKKKHFDIKATHSKYQFSSLRQNSGTIYAGDQTSRRKREKGANSISDLSIDRVMNRQFLLAIFTDAKYESRRPWERLTVVHIRRDSGAFCPIRSTVSRKCCSQLLCSPQSPLLPWCSSIDWKHRQLKTL